jgi:hypothetical protein
LTLVSIAVLLGFSGAVINQNFNKSDNELNEIDVDAERLMPKTLHSAQVISVLKGELPVNFEIKILQDGTEDLLVNDIPIYKSKKTMFLS